MAIVIPGVTMIGEDFTYSIWYNKDDKLMKLFKTFQNKFGNDDSAIIGIHRPEGIFNKKTLKTISAITEDLWLVEKVVRVDSLTNTNIIKSQNDEIDIAPLIDMDEIDSYTEADFQRIKKDAVNDPMFKNLFVDKDGTLALIKANAMSDINGVPDYNVMSLSIRKIIEKHKTDDIEIHGLGTVLITHYFKEITIDDVGFLVPLSTLVFIILLFIFYRNITGVILPFLVIQSSIVLMLGVTGYLGHALNTLSSAGPTILLTVAMADAIHFITVYFHGLKSGLSNKESVQLSLYKNFYPTLLTSVTTAIGFFSFYHSKVVPVSLLGMEVAIGVLFAWLSTFCLIPTLLLIFPPKKLIAKKHLSAHSIENKDEVVFSPGVRAKKAVDILIKQRWPILFTSAALMLLSIFFISKLQVNMNPIDQFKESHPLKQGFNLMTDKLGSVTTLEIMINSNETDGIKDPKFLKRVELLEKWLLQRPYITGTTSILDIIKKLNKTMNNDDENFYVIPDEIEKIAEEIFLYTMFLPPGQDLNNLITINNDSIRLTVLWEINSSTEALVAIQSINQKARELGLSAFVTGKTPLFHELTPYVVDTFFNSLTIALIMITGIMIIVLKSFKLGMLSLIPNILPLMLGGMITYFFGFDIDMGIVIVASVCLGIAVDDSIHFLFEYQKYRKQKKSVREALEIVVSSTFPSLFFTTLIIVIGFGSFVFADYIPNSRFGIMVAIVLIIALIADFLILPAIIAVFDGDKKKL